MGVQALCSILKPSPLLPEIQNREEVQQKYQYWRLRIFYSMYVGYLFYYFTRKSFTFITPFLMDDLGLTRAQIGALASVLSIAYGASRFTSGVLSDRSNPRYFMSIGLILTGVFNILFGFSSSIYLLAVFWGLNGWFQGWGWAACTKQLTHWFSRGERGTWWSAATTSHTVGGFLIAYVAAYCAAWWGWRWAMWIPGSLCIAVGFWLINRQQDVPQSMGLPPVEKYKNESVGDIQKNEGTLLSIKQLLFEQVLCNKYVWVLAVSYFFVYVVRTAVNDWGPLYLFETKGYDKITAAACVSWFEIGGFFGILIAGFGSDYWFKGKRVPLMVIATLGLAFSLIGLWHLEVGSFFMASLLIALVGFLVFVPQMLVGLAAAEFVSKQAASTSSGFVGCFASLGAAVAGYPLGKLTDLFGWYGFIVFLVVSAIITVLVLFPVWSVKTKSPTEENISHEGVPAVLQEGYLSAGNEV